MGFDLKQFVPQKVCLSCDGCCRFKDADSDWRPRVAREEMAEGKASRPPLDELILSSDKLDPRGQIKTKSCGSGGHLCTFFDLEQNTCRIYADRPLDCRLYPFVLVRKNNCVELCVHLNCPFVQEKYRSGEFTEYAEYLKEFFASEGIRRLLNENPGLAGEYSGYESELEKVFTVEGAG